MADVTHYLYRIRPSRPEMLSQGSTPDEDQVLTRHFAYLKELTERGVVTLAGRTLNADENGFGIVIVRTGSEDAARGVMNGDPAVKHGVMLAELFPFRLALMSRR